MITPSMLRLLGLLAKCEGAYRWLRHTDEAERSAKLAKTEALVAFLDEVEFAWVVAQVSELDSLAARINSLPINVRVRGTGRGMMHGDHLQ